MTEFWQEFYKEVKTDTSSIASEGTSSGTYTGHVDTGSYMLNALLCGSIFGGFQNNKVIGLAGDPATGKTFFVLSAMKAFLDDDPEAVVFFYDTEAAMSDEVLVARDIDPTRVFIFEPETLEEFREHVLKVLNSYLKKKGKGEAPPCLMVLDSLGMVPSIKELTDAEDGSNKRDMTKQPVIRSLFRSIILKLARAGIAMMLTNHTYQVIGSYIPTKEVAGGGGLKYAASTILALAKKVVKDSNKEATGVIISATTYKSRFSKENQIVDVYLDYRYGLDRYYGLVEFAVKHGIIEKNGAWYVIDGEKVQGSDKIYSNPEKYFTKDFLTAVDNAAKKVFKYQNEEDE